MNSRNEEEKSLSEKELKKAILEVIKYRKKMKITEKTEPKLFLKVNKGLFLL